MKAELTPIEQLVFDTVEGGDQWEIGDVCYAIEGEIRKSTRKVVGRALNHLTDLGLLDLETGFDGEPVFSRRGGTLPKEETDFPGSRYIVEGGKAYRILREDEKVIKGDECFTEDLDEWEPSSNWQAGVAGGKQSEGMLYRRECELPMGIGPVETLLKAIHGKDFRKHITVNG